MYYFDHAASSFPKPHEVGEAMKEAVDLYAANPGRGGHTLSQKAAAIVKEARTEIASLFKVPKNEHVWFYQNATMALNQAILGYPFEEGDHILVTVYEHNSVLRPIKMLELEKGVRVTYVKPNELDEFDLDDFESQLTEQTKMVVVTHASNITGSIFPVAEFGLRLEKHQAIFVVDASQTAGKLNISMEHDHIDLLAFAGHKGLLGPQGTGVLISKHDYQLAPLIHGGTGTSSEEDVQPLTWPERYEAGTLNTPGIAGLLAGVKAVKLKGIDAIFEHEEALMKQFIEGISNVEDIQMVGQTSVENRVSVVSFHVKHVPSHEVAMILDSSYQIAVRAGLHCAPRAHQHLDTIQEGLVRVSFGPYNTEEEVKQLVNALHEIVEAFSM
ncbi:aminotransferase class V-fold PLP-dependent enzyme [Alkalicoccobacillus porphyridii]|uniref:cysteine desulfurase n=1 Tax=Alkalicoccobacillus porphyridii TaxID=2597270 RepID=A0A554A1F7_9BACI|nr:aminotransferase class V-fold PLP-dependent enzyme [Alkalicoccobacillus porphyridii]TSB47531.1 aminotransferase class V-fold PLP-dependent enzyme [Alkalicoccobacillus porphyridii]